MTAHHPHRCTCHPGALTDLELEALAALANGISLDAVARRHGVAASTTAEYVARARQKLGAKDRAHLVALAFRHGVLRVDGRGRVVARPLLSTVRSAA